MDAALQAIAEPRRREILRLVWTEEMRAGDIAARFEGVVTRPAISQHLRVLKDAGLLAERRAGTSRLYRARPEGLNELREYLETLWDTSLERLKSEAEREAKKEKERHASNGKRN